MAENKAEGRWAEAAWPPAPLGCAVAARARDGRLRVELLQVRPLPGSGSGWARAERRHLPGGRWKTERVYRSGVGRPQVRLLGDRQSGDPGPQPSAGVEARLWFLDDGPGAGPAALELLRRAVRDRARALAADLGDLAASAEPF